MSPRTLAAIETCESQIVGYAIRCEILRQERATTVHAMNQRAAHYSAMACAEDALHFSQLREALREQGAL